MKGGCLQQNFSAPGLHGGFHSTHNTRQGHRTLSIRHDQILRTQRMFSPVQTVQAFPRFRSADRDRVPLQALRIEDMDRLPQFHKDEVRHVDQQAERSETGRIQFFPHPLGRIHPRSDEKTGQRVVRAQLPLLHRYVPTGQHTFGAAWSGRTRFQRHPEGGKFPRQTCDRGEVGTIRCDLHLDHRLPRIQALESHPQGRGRGQEKKTLRIVGQSQLLARTKHSLRSFPPKFGRLDGHPIRENGPRFRQRNNVALAVVFRSTHDLPRPRAIVHPTYGQTIRVGVGLLLENLRRHDPLCLATGRTHADHLGPALGEQIRQLRRRPLPLGPLPQPAEGNLHSGLVRRGESGFFWANWSRNRAAPSKSSIAMSCWSSASHSSLPAFLRAGRFPR